MHGHGINNEETTCPICLQGYEPADRAVISSCLHAFCIGCLQAWCRKSEARLCPLCKRRIDGYIYAIKSDHDYREHVFEDELQQQQQQLEHWPVQLVQPSQGSQRTYIAHQRISRTAQQQQVRTRDEQHDVTGGGGGHATQRLRIQLRAEPGYTWGDPADWRRDVVQARRRLHSARSAAASAATTSSSSHQWHSSSRSRWGEGAVDPHGDGSASAGGDGSVAPRPYYWRVQQRMLASVTRQHSNSSAAAGDSSAALEARRAIYRNNLWALPHHTAVAAAAAAVSSSGGSSSHMHVSEAALDTWMERELQALLLEDDVTIICAYVKGLVNSFGVNVPTTQQQQQQLEGVRHVANLHSMRQAATQAAAAVGFSTTAAATAAGGSSNTGTITSAVAALEGFLFEAADHFWHELCCYASSGLTVAAWDRAAKYVHRDQLQQHLPKQQQQQPAPGRGCEVTVEGPQHDVPSQHMQQQQQQQVVAYPLCLDQELSAIRDAAAVAGFLERQQMLRQQASRAHQPAAAAGSADAGDAAVASASPAAAVGAETAVAANAVEQPQQPQIGIDRSSSGSSSSRDQQHQQQPSSRHKVKNSMSRQRSRSRSRSKGRQYHTSHKHDHHHRSHSSHSSRHSRRNDRSSSQQPRERRSGRSEFNRSSTVVKAKPQPEQYRHYMYGVARDSNRSRDWQYEFNSTIGLARSSAAAPELLDSGLSRWGDEDDVCGVDGVMADVRNKPGLDVRHLQQQQQQGGLEWGASIAADTRWQMEGV